jgi:two-component system chemotaxis sensor kinase CheA
MENTANNLHKFETRLSKMENVINTLTNDKLKEFFTNEDFASWINEDITNLKNILGEQFFTSNNRITISEDKFKRIENEILKIMTPSEYKVKLPELANLKKKSLKSILTKYTEYTIKLSNRIGKSVYTFNIEGDDLYIEYEKYHWFLNSLVNIFRNAIVHGIELPYERIQNNKNEYGTIKCIIESDNGSTIINISDDGKGIDIAKIKEKLILYGIKSEEELSNFDEKEIIEYIFMDKLSTQSEINDLSGRGEGLAAVKSEVVKLSGKIIVKTEKLCGTTFSIIIPNDDFKL